MTATLLQLLPFRVPIRDWVETAVDYLLDNFYPQFDAFSDIVFVVVDTLRAGLLAVPPVVVIAVIALLAWRVAGIGVGVLAALGLLLAENMGLWRPTMETFGIVLTAELIVIVIGFPLGIIAARYDAVDRVLRPVLDFMQTMPAFVYLIPAVMFFGLGMVPGVMATVIFALPPLIRLTNLGIRQVPKELVEAGEAFGSSNAQMLWKVQLPVALPTVMTGLNQSIMLALSMVVIGAMIGAGGLGSEVLRGIQRLQVGVGFESGLAVVILAIILDRVTQGLSAKSKVGG